MTDLEQRVARARKIRYDEMDLASSAADFYLLECLANIKEDEFAKKKLLEFESVLARQFSTYLDVAVGGELRYAKLKLGSEEIPRELRPFFKEVRTRGFDRGTAWLVWGVVRRKMGIHAVRLAQEVFESPGWEGAFGGEAWAAIAKVLLAYLEGKVNDRIFVDRCWSLEHNSNLVFDKMWSTLNVETVLAAHGIDEYDTLLEHASEEVRRMWNLHHRRKRRVTWEEHDPTWLGASAWEPEIVEAMEVPTK
jgi:hypothetical protein